MADSIPKLVTVGVIAAEVGITVKRVEYILRTRDYIRPSALAGNVRLFSNEALAQVRYEAILIDTRRLDTAKESSDKTVESARDGQ